MMESSLIEEFNRQINRELSSSYIYYAMASYFSNIHHKGFEKFMKESAKEELNHAKKLYDFLILRHAPIMFEALEAPDFNFSCPEDVFQAAIEHERYITKSLVNLRQSAKEYKDDISEIFLNDLIIEQAEEEDKFLTILERIEYDASCGCTIEHIDAEYR